MKHSTLVISSLIDESHSAFGGGFCETAEVAHRYWEPLYINNQFTIVASCQHGHWSTCWPQCQSVSHRIRWTSSSRRWPGAESKNQRSSYPHLSTSSLTSVHISRAISQLQNIDFPNLPSCIKCGVLSKRAHPQYFHLISIQTMKYKDNCKEQPSNIQRVSPCIALPVWGKLSGRQQWQKQTNQGTQTGAAKKHWDWNSFLKSYSSSSSAMFTAGNMTYMRKRKKERQAAKRAMARENVSLWNP